MRRIAPLVALVGCSFVTVRPSRPPDPTDCTTIPGAAIFDTAVTLAGIGVPAVGLAMGCQGSDGCGLGVAVAVVMAVAATPFAFSSYYGFSRTHECREAIEAERARGDARYEQCAKTRWRMVSELASYDPERRARTVRDLPVCAPPPDQDATSAASLDEQAWTTTRDAALSALAGDCRSVVDAGARVRTLSRSRYETIFLAEPDIAACIGEQPAAVHATCVEDRTRRRNEAMQITDLKERGRILQSLPDCDPTH